VRDEQLKVMLLNEFLKAHRKNEQQEATIAESRQQIAVITRGLQKVTARLELSRPVLRTGRIALLAVFPSPVFSALLISLG
jgi:hypothetical protein